MFTRRAVTLVLLPLWLSACSRWHEVRDPVPLLSSNARPANLRVTLRDGRVSELWQPHLSGDSVYGLAKVEGRTEPGRASHQPFGEPLANIARTESKGTNGVVVVLGFVAAATVVALIAKALGQEMLESSLEP